MKRILLIIGASVIIIIISGVIALRSWIGNSVKEHIDVATEKYDWSKISKKLASDLRQLA